MKKWMGLTGKHELIIHRLPVNGDQVLLVLAAAMEIGYFLPWYYIERRAVNGFEASLSHLIYFCAMLSPLIVGGVRWMDGKKRWGQKYALACCLCAVYFFLVGQNLISAWAQGKETGKLIWLCVLTAAAGAAISGISFWLNDQEQKVGQKKMNRLKTRKICRECGAVLEANAKFCRECGNVYKEPELPQVVEKVSYCAYCGRKVGECIQYCVYCGTKVEEHALFCPCCGKKIQRCH